MMQEHPGKVGYPAWLGDLMGSCGPIFMFEGFFYSCVDLLGSWVIGFDVFNGAWHGLDCSAWSGRSSVLLGIWYLLKAI